MRKEKVKKFPELCEFKDFTWHVVKEYWRVTPKLNRKLVDTRVLTLGFENYSFRSTYRIG